MKRDFTQIFCIVDDFLKNLDQGTPVINGCKNRSGPKNSLNISEIITILIGFHDSGSDCFKNYYNRIILQQHQDDFNLVSYSRFITIIKDALPSMTIVLNQLFSKCTGISFVDSTSIAVCKNYRIYSHQVFQGFASRGKTTKGWFYGLKLHLVINPEGSIVKASFSSGNKDDRKHFRNMTNGIFGKVFGDRGYISKDLFKNLWNDGIELVTRLKKGMKNALMSMADKALLLRRALIETVIGRIKLLEKFEHSRHRSPTNAFAHMIASLLNYQLLPNKPSIYNLISLPSNS